MKEWIVLEKHIGKSCSERIEEGFNGWNNGWISYSRMSRISVYKVGVPGKELTRGIFVTSWTTEGSAAAKSLQFCPTLCDPIDGSPQGSPIPGILQARKLEWVAISFSNAWKWRVKVKSLSHVRLSATPWTAAYQASPSMGFSRQEYWSGLPLPSLIKDSRDWEIIGLRVRSRSLEGMRRKFEKWTKEVENTKLRF